MPAVLSSATTFGSLWPSELLQQSSEPHAGGRLSPEPYGQPAQNEGEEVARIPIGQTLQSHPYPQPDGRLGLRVFMKFPECAERQEAEELHCLSPPLVPTVGKLAFANFPLQPVSPRRSFLIAKEFGYSFVHKDSLFS